MKSGQLLDKLQKLYLKVLKDDAMDIKSIHKLRAKTREVISHTDKKDKAYKKLKKIIKLTNEIRDIDVFQSEFLENLPVRYTQNISLNSMLKKLQEQREKYCKSLKNYLVKFKIPKKLTTKKDIDTTYIDIPKEKITSKLSDKELHKYRIYIKNRLYYYKLFYPNEKKMIKKLTKLKDYLGFIHDNFNAQKRIISFYPHIEKELKEYIEKENQKLFKKISHIEII